MELVGRLLVTLLVAELCILSESIQFCKTETFSATCSDQEVVLMEHAQFGRMQLGRCVKANYGNIGCAKDVLELLDHRCSGRRVCEMSVSDPTLVRTKPCPMDFSSSLEAAFQCVPVVNVPNAACKTDGQYTVIQNVGYLSPLSATHARHGKSCPVVIRAHPGQKVAFVLLDFASGNNTVYSRGGGNILQFCQQYAIIKEPLIRSSVPICSGEDREKQVYLSRTHHVQIALPRGDNFQFLLRFEVVGCPRLQLQDGAYAKYEPNAVTVVCNATRETFTLACKNNSWIGDLKNCSSPVDAASERKAGDTLVNLPPIGISIIIILGVALVIVVYVAIMIVCVLYLRRRRKKARRAACGGGAGLPACKGPGGMLHDPSKLEDKDQALNPEERLPMLVKKGGVLRVSGGEYTDICEMHELNKPYMERHLGGGNYIKSTCSVNTFPVRGPGPVPSQAGNEESAYSTGGSCIYHPGGSQTLQGRAQSTEPQTEHVHTVYEPRRAPMRTMSRDGSTTGSVNFVENAYGFPFYFELETGSVAKASGVLSGGPDIVPNESGTNRKSKSSASKSAPAPQS